MDANDLKRFGLDIAFPFRKRYDNYIGGKWVAPAAGNYLENISPIDGQVFCEVARSDATDIEHALDAAHAARRAWGKTSVTDRANILLAIADRIEQHLTTLAVAETIDNGKPLRETLAADLPLAVDHFRYFAGCIRAQEGGISEIDENTVAYHFHEPMGVVGQIIPWNFPLLMAAWKLAPALAAGNCVVLKPAEQTPASIMVMAELIGDLLPPGVLNIVNGLGREAGEALATSTRIAKLAFTGSTPVGKHILHAAADNLVPTTVELGGKSPNIFFADVMDQDDAFLDKALEGLTMFALNQGEICTCPSRILVQESIYDRFIEKAIARVQKISAGHPLDKTTMVGEPSFLPAGLAQKEGDGPYGRMIHFGVREHAMGNMLNGIVQSELTRAYGGTFLVFSDYMRPAVRLAALQKLPTVFVWSHDSIGVGEDGPTHQPIEHIASLRVIPGLSVVRPADANEAAQAWLGALAHRDSPTGLVLSRQNLPIFDRSEGGFAPAEGTLRGAYTLVEASNSKPQVLLLATGSEVALAVEARQALEAEGIPTRVVSVPCWEWFHAQDAEYRESVLPSQVKARVAMEAASSMGWRDWVGDAGEIIAIDEYGESATPAELFEYFGFTVDNVVAKAKQSLARA